MPVGDILAELAGYWWVVAIFVFAWVMGRVLADSVRMDLDRKELQEALEKLEKAVDGIEPGGWIPGTSEWAYHEKPKRKRLVLVDDGEYAEDIPEEKPKRSELDI